MGYEASELVGSNVSVLCPPAVEKRHAQYMAHYKGAARSKIVGRVRNLEARHKVRRHAFFLFSLSWRVDAIHPQNGALLPMSLEVSEESSEPHPVFGAHFTEVDADMEGIVTVGPSGIMESVSDSCRTIWGYELEELVGKHFHTIAPNVALREGENTVLCQHKDGSKFYVSTDINTFTLDGNQCFRGIVRRVADKKKKNKVAMLLLLLLPFAPLTHFHLLCSLWVRLMTSFFLAICWVGTRSPRRWARAILAPSRWPRIG